MKRTREQFIEKAIEIHGDKYDYSKVEYINSRQKVYMICPEHGEFWQTPNAHIQGSGCPKCAKDTSKLTTEDFIEKAKEIHGDKYDYSKVGYIDCKNKVCIICSEHGEFLQIPNSHLQGAGCPKCAIDRSKLTTEDFIKKVKDRFGNQYTFEKTEYINSDEKVMLTCKKHGDFSVTPNKLFGMNRYCPKCRREEARRKQTEKWKKQFVEKHGDRFDYTLIGDIIPNNTTKLPIKCRKHNHIFYQDVNHHLHYKWCCPICETENASERMSDDLDAFIKKARITHGDKYVYSKVEYVTSQTNVCIICPEHGEFWQRPAAHIRGCGCPQCALMEASLRILKTKEQFIEDARKIHGGKYDYSKVEYIDCKQKVCIICPKHGEFWQTPDAHVQGHGCSVCKSSSLETQVRVLLENSGVEFISQKSLRELTNEMLGDKPQRIDFFLPQYNLCIECQGQQHFRPTTFGKVSKEKAEELYKKNVLYDNFKYNALKKYDFDIVYLTKPFLIKYDTDGWYENKKVFYNVDTLYEYIRTCADSNIKRDWYDNENYILYKNHRQPKTIWNKETCYQEAQKYNTRGDFSKYSKSAYHYARINKWLDDFDWFKELHHKWTYEECYQEALKYKTKSEFNRNNSKAFRASQRNKWINDYNWLT